MTGIPFVSDIRPLEVIIGPSWIAKQLEALVGNLLWLEGSVVSSDIIVLALFSSQPGSEQTSAWVGLGPGTRDRLTSDRCVAVFPGCSPQAHGSAFPWLTFVGPSALPAAISSVAMLLHQVLLEAIHTCHIP
jgi:hypothetical protein